MKGIYDMKTEKKIGFLISVFMSFVMGLVLSLVNSFLSGHFEVKTWLISFGISFVLALIIGLIVPVGKIDRGLHSKISNKFAASFLSGFVSNLIYSPVMTAVMTFVMVSLALNSMNGAISGMQNQKTELESSVAQVTEERANLETEHNTYVEEQTALIAEQQQILDDLQADRETRLKKLQTDIEKVPDNNSIEKTLREYMKKLLENETNTEEILKDYAAKIDNEMEKSNQIPDEIQKNNTLLSLQKQVDFTKNHLEEYYALVDMVKTIADQNEKVKGMNDDFKKTDEEQAAALEQMKNQIEEMHSTIENLEYQIEAVSNARPDMKESMIHSEIISCIAGLFLCIIFQPIAQKCAVAIAVPKAPNAKPAKKKEEVPETTETVSSDTEESVPKKEDE